MIAQEEVPNEPGKETQIQPEEELQEVNLGAELGSHKPVFVNSQLAAQEKGPLVALLKEYTDVFAWSYDKMPVDDLQNPRIYIVWTMNMNTHIYLEFVVSFKISSKTEGVTSCQVQEYAEYVDVVQPLQVAVYEMKLGSSLVLASVFQKDLLSMVELDDMDLIMGTIYSFMIFPRGFPSKLISVNLGSTQLRLLSYDIDVPTIFSAADMTLLEKLVTFSNGVAVEKVSVKHLKASLHQNVIVRVAHHVANAQLVDKDSFKHLHVSLNIILNFGDALLQDLLVMYRTVRFGISAEDQVDDGTRDRSEDANGTGFGISAEDQVDDGTRDRSEDANGTGMGEGAGMNDVSDQITDEDQLIWALDKVKSKMPQMKSPSILVP
nr:putative inactive poly [adp-ribose] polymerase sro1 [Quercus suber]